MFKSKDISKQHAYAEISLVYNACDNPSKFMCKTTAFLIKDRIDRYFIAEKASQYENILYDALLECNLIPTDPNTSKPYTRRDCRTLKADKSNPDVELVRSIGKFYQCLRDHMDEYDRPRTFSFSDLAALKEIAPHDPRWFNLVCELEDYAKKNQIFR